MTVPCNGIGGSCGGTTKSDRQFTVDRDPIIESFVVLISCNAEFSVFVSLFQKKKIQY